jgi:hypothetical protein
MPHVPSIIMMTMHYMPTYYCYLCARPLATYEGLCGHCRPDSACEKEINVAYASE